MRDTPTRKADVLAALGRQGDAWIATADRKGTPHLIAMSAWWDGAAIVVATLGASRTALNLTENPVARLALGEPGDAIVIDAQVVDTRPAEESGELATGFAGAVGWDPREVGAGWRFFRFKPVRIQAYRGYEEIEGRLVMRRGQWLA